MRATLNIGLNNNPLSQKEIVSNLRQDYDIISVKPRMGQYEGQDEPTLIIEIDSPYARTSHFIKKIEGLATVLTQNCIAVSTDQFDILVYAHDYQGERYKFDPEYFIKS